MTRGGMSQAVAYAGMWSVRYMDGILVMGSHALKRRQTNLQMLPDFATADELVAWPIRATDTREKADSV